MDRLRREERADTGDPAVGIHRKRLSGEIVVAVEDGEAVVLAQGTHILVAVNVVRGILDGVDDTVVIQPRNELLAQPAAGQVRVVIEDQRNREFGTDGLIMVVGFLLVRRNVPGGDDHDAVGPGFLCGPGEQDRVRGAVRAGAGINLAAMVYIFDGVAVDLQLLLQRHGYQLACAAAGDDARRAVFDQKVNQLVKRGIVDVFILPAEGSHKREYNAAQFSFFHSYAPLRDDFGISIPIFKNSITESKTECNMQNS